MQYEIECTQGPEEVFTYVLMHLRTLMPDDWAKHCVREDDRESSSARVTTKAGARKRLRVFKDTDSMLVSEVFGHDVGLVEVLARDGKIFVTGQKDGDALARKLSELPVWAHKVVKQDD